MLRGYVHAKAVYHLLAFLYVNYFPCFLALVSCAVQPTLSPRFFSFGCPHALYVSVLFCTPPALSPCRSNNSTAGSTSRQENETKLLVKCMMECYRAHPNQVAMLLDLAAVFLYPTPMDFTFLKVSWHSKAQRV